MNTPHVNGPRLFTLDEANALVPFLSERLDEFSAVLTEMEAVRDDLAVARLVGASGGDEDNPDRKVLEDLEARAEALGGRLERIQRDVLWSGCVPKSYRDGLIDFFALKDGRLVFLCWRRGEKRIAFWHTLDGGFQGRKPIRTFLTDPPGADLA